MPNGNTDPVHIEEAEPRAPESAQRNKTRRRNRKRRGRTYRKRAALLRLAGTDFSQEEIKKGSIVFMKPKTKPMIVKLKVRKIVYEDLRNIENHTNPLNPLKPIKAILKVVQEYDKDGHIVDDSHIIGFESEETYPYQFSTPNMKWFRTLDEAVDFQFKNA